ncbi:MAG: DUF1905 domain-containing protein [Arthrobacter sp.]|uniref:DUF1905 domain-containing protein n=1 Tax=Arthrobacter sp. TaxID=1667 RepID=UPI00348F5294
MEDDNDNDYDGVAVAGPVVYWRGPAPFPFVRVPGEEASCLRSVAPAVTYGWGMVPVTATVRGTAFTTSLIPKDGGYLVPLKDVVRAAEALAVGDVITVRLRTRR